MRNLKFAVIVAIVSGVLLLTTIILTLVLNPKSQIPTKSSSNIPSSSNNTVSNYQAPPPELKPTQGKAIIQGKLCPQNGSEILPTFITVESIPSRTKTQKFYPGLSIAKTNLFYFELDPGTYTFYTENSNREKNATFSQFVTCGMNENFCISHDLVELSLNSGDILTNVDLCDYRWQTRFQNIPTTPTNTNDPNSLPTPVFDPNEI